MNSEYYLPRIKDGMPTTVKNVAFLHAHNTSIQKKNIFNDEDISPSRNANCSQDKDARQSMT